MPLAILQLTHVCTVGCQVNNFISDAGALITPGAWSTRTSSDDAQIAATGAALNTLADGVGSLATKYSTTSDDYYAALQALQTLIYDARNPTLSGSSTPTMLALKNDLPK